MGRNLAINVERRGYSVSVNDYCTYRTNEFIGEEASDKDILRTKSIEMFVKYLEIPLKILVMEGTQFF